MKLSRKNLGRIATTFLATAMLASLTAVPAMAADHGEFEPDAEETQVKINKSITKPGESYLPDVKFDFDIAPVGSAPANGATFAIDAETQQADDKIDSHPGAALVAGQSEIDTVNETNTVTLAEQLVIDLNIEEFAGMQPGEYMYTITENGGTYENGYTWSAQSLTLKVIIARDESNNNALYVYGYELYNPQDPSDKKDTFNNLYLTKDGTSDPTKGFDLTKIVDGSAATSSDEAAHYKFTVTISNDTNDSSVKNYYAVVTHSNTACASQPNTVYTIVENRGQQIEIAEGDELHVYGLTVNDTMSVEELEDSVAGFTKTTYKIDSGDSQEGRNSAIDNFEADHAIEYTNTKDAVSPTGIAMDIAPYALLVVIAAAGCFVFLRKRNED